MHSVQQKSSENQIYSRYLRILVGLIGASLNAALLADLSKDIKKRRNAPVYSNYHTYLLQARL